ncbi:sodium:solute symporter [candidate division KSB1 bacterium]|nr:sodium:solute symporter [candidate division KSB1 bacterium]
MSVPILRKILVFYSAKYKQASGLLLVVLVALVGFACSTPPGEPISFENFLTQFSKDQQQAAKFIWEQLGHDEKIDVAEIPPESISDEALFESISDSLKNKAQMLDEIQTLRQQLSLALAKNKELAQLHSRWQRFTKQTEGNPELGAVYLKALAREKQVRSLAEESKKNALSLQTKIQRIREGASLSHVSLNFTWEDWVVIVVYLIFTTILGGLLAGKQASMKDFFLGGRKLAWPAVCGSIIATELSAATFLIAPAIVFSKGGDMTYLQLAIGTIIARFIIGYFFIPVYYEREIYSPYDYMGNRLGPRVKNITSLLFMIGGILAQGARVYIAAKAMQVITGTNITTSIVIIGAVSICWTIMGGITTVIWTDAIQFLLFSVGAIAALIFIDAGIDGGIATVVSEGLRAGKFNLINLNFNVKDAYTLWCGLFATGFLTLGSHGTDQLMAQRMFTCKSQDDARKAVIWSSVSQVLTLLLLMVGASIFIYYKHLPLNKPEQVIVDADSMKIFAIYIVDVMPPMLSGLLMAALFATAISTLDSILAALSQSTIEILYKPFVKPVASETHYVRASRIIVLLWGIVLTAFAIYCDTLSQSFGDLIQFALAMAAYTYGALLGTFLLAFLPTRRDDLGLMWGVPLSMLIVFAFNWHQTVPQIIVLIACIVLVIQAFRHLKEQPQKVLYVGLAAGLVLLISMAVIGTTPDSAPVHISLAWPWHFPIGAAMTFIIGYLVGNEKH